LRIIEPDRGTVDYRSMVAPGMAHIRSSDRWHSEVVVAIG